MDYKKITIIGFIITCLAQLFVPAKMIFDQEDVLKTGTEYKFRTRPVDPNDPFRGKYIVLDYTDNTFLMKEKNSKVSSGNVFVEFSTDNEGFAKIKNVTKVAPGHSDFLSTSVSYVTTKKDDETELVIHYPFDRYYMEESKAKPAEDAYREANRDTAKVTYALVHIKNGSAVLKDVILDGKSIKGVVKEMEGNEN